MDSLKRKRETVESRSTSHSMVSFPTRYTTGLGGNGMHCALTSHERKPAYNDSTKERIFLMPSHRKPLNSPRPPGVVKKLDLSLHKETVPIKRCFSKETLELSRQRIIVTKKSKVDISVLPPKRARLDDFQFASTSSRTPNHHSHSSSQRYISANNKAVSTGQLKLLNSHPRKVFCPVSSGECVQNGNALLKKEYEKSTSKTKPPVNKVKGNLSFFLVSIKNFPMSEWKENGCDAEMLREIMFLSDDSSAIPVNIAQRNGQLVVKRMGSGNDDTNEMLRSTNRQESVLSVIVKSPIIFSFKLMSGVMKWIMGN